MTTTHSRSLLRATYYARSAAVFAANLADALERGDIGGTALDAIEALARCQRELGRLAALSDDNGEPLARPMGRGV